MTDDQQPRQKSNPWLKEHLDTKAKLDLLELDAVAAWSLLKFHCATADSRTILKRDVPAALGRRLAGKRLVNVLDSLVNHVGLLKDLGDAYEHTEWHQIAAEVWADPVLRQRDARNKRLTRDTELTNRIKARDRNLCRYCGVRVRWGSQTGPQGGTYDHVDPDVMENTYDGVVVACRTCNGRKKDRTPEQAAMPRLRAGIDSAAMQAVLDRGASPYVDPAAWARPERQPRSGAPPGRADAQPGLTPGPSGHVRARETGPGRAGAQPDQPATERARPPRPGVEPDHADDPDRLASLIDGATDLQPPDTGDSNP